MLFSLRYVVPQVQSTGKKLNGYPMFSVKNIVQNINRIELWDKNLVPLHFVISKISFLFIFPIAIQRITTISLINPSSFIKSLKK